MLSAEIKQRIQEAYRRYIEAKGFRPRYGQRLMVAEVARTFAEAGVEDGEPDPSRRRWCRGSAASSRAIAG